MAATYDFVDQKSKKSLSSNLMQMKFMQRKQETDLQKQQEKRIKQRIEASHWTANPSENDLQKNVIIEPSFVVCEELNTIGRMSFNGFNPEIEKLHQDVLKEDELERAGMRENEEQISDSEMASRMEGINDTISKKFSKKRQRKPSSSNENEITSNPGKRSKVNFMKPKVD